MSLRMSLALLTLYWVAPVFPGEEIFQVDCQELRLGQYLCSNPEIDEYTQQPKGCSRAGLSKTVCTAADGLVCTTSLNNTFEKDVPCKWTNNYSYETALLLSVFLGMFGIDRFYLGYPAIGLLKLCTCGFMFVGQLVDIILIATQTVGPADGSSYIINYFGQGLNILRTDENTYRQPMADWN